MLSEIIAITNSDESNITFRGGSILIDWIGAELSDAAAIVFDVMFRLTEETTQAIAIYFDVFGYTRTWLSKAKTR